MVKAWKEKVSIPTYEIGKPEKNPIFLEKRVYQGSSGAVYPYPVIESISNEKKDKEYNVVYIENEYIKVMVMPELGGRIQMAYDKIRQRHFVYYNHVIKPALVGLAGPWISGGIEFNWPQHHRPSTFLPVDVRIDENSDGSVTVWVSEIERMFHQKGMAGFTLRPGCAYLEIKGVLYNRTDIPQTFLWWANPAVAVNDSYQSIFPPDINAVFDHGKRAVSTFPIATGVYYKMDYSAGVDISNYKNIYVPTSYMAVNSKYDFEGGYENDTRAGMLHIANHHVSPGKKQWTWGNGDFGRAWDRNLTDEDGPYIELMAGVYTENQPDFSWLQPYEEKSFVQYFLPFRELGIVKNANRDFLINIEPAGPGKVRFMIYATSGQRARIVLHGDDGTVFYEKDADIDPEQILDETVETAAASFDSLNLDIVVSGKLSLHWHAEPDEIKPVPDPAEAALSPEDTKTTEQLYLTGLHLEQYRHATWSPVDYYEEALKRDPYDIRNNNALGLWYIRKGRFRKAEGYLRTAVKMLCKRNPNPYDGEPVYNLGLSLKYQGRYDEAYGYFYKSTWNGALQDAGYFECAQISCLQGRYEDALYECGRSLLRNWHNHKARTLKTAILARMGRVGEAMAFAEESLEIDGFNFGCLFLKCLYGYENEGLLKELMRHESHNYDEIALDFSASGLWKEAVTLWNVAIEEAAISPMSLYYLAWTMSRAQGDYDPVRVLEEARGADPYCCFPNRLEAVLALQYAMETQPEDSKAPYYLGNLYYDKKQYDLAMTFWEKSRSLDPLFPTVWRNLALAYYNKLHDKEKARSFMEKAYSLDETDPRILMELDQLYKKLHVSPEDRLANLRKHRAEVEQRDDLVLEEIALLNLTGDYSCAKEKLDNRIFHPWEGGEGKVPAQYQYSRVELAKIALSESRYRDAISLLEECLVYPPNLGEGKLYGAQENDFYYFLGCAYSGMQDTAKAEECWEKAVLGPVEPAAAMYYNDAKPEKIFYQGLALRKLGREDEARSRFHKLISYGEKHLFDKVVMDYFAVSLPDLLIWEDNLQDRNTIHCKFMLALGYWGTGDKERSTKHLKEVLSLDPDHVGLHSFISFMEFDRR